MNQHHNHTPDSRLFTQTGVLFYLADGTIQSCNPNAAKILGYDIERLIGLSIYELPWRAAEEDLKIALWHHNPEYINQIIEIERSDLTLARLSVNTLTLFKANLREPYGVEVAFTEQKAIGRTTASRSISAASQPALMPRQLVGLLPETVYLYDAIAGCNIYTNTEAYSSLGYTTAEKNELAADFIVRVMHPEDAPRFRQHIARLRTLELGDIGRFEYRMRHKNGSWRWFCSSNRVYS